MQVDDIASKEAVIIQKRSSEEVIVPERTSEEAIVPGGLPEEVVGAVDGRGLLLT
jgi:hypothetical protein